MKKAVILLLACVMCFTFISCGKDDNGNDSGASDVFTVKYRDTQIELGAKAESIIQALGEPTSKKEIGDCGGLGAQIKYTYPSLVIYTLKNSDGETVDQIDILDDLITTSKGVYIGSSADEVKKAHGEPDKTNDTSLQYISGNKYLKFGIKDGKVTSISFLRETK